MLLAQRMLLVVRMSKYSRISKQLWELSVIGMMGLTMVGLEATEGDGERSLSGEVLLDLESEGIDYEDHRELFTGPATMAEVASQLEDWNELSDGPITAHIDSMDELREELGSSLAASLDRKLPTYNLWDESWETSAALESFPA